MKINKRNRKLLKKLSLLDKKNLVEASLKLTEEVGEVAEAVLSCTKVHGCEYKTKTPEDIVEEVTDVIIVAMSILHKLKKQTDIYSDVDKYEFAGAYTVEGLFGETMFKKLTKWEEKLNSPKIQIEGDIK